MRHQNFKSVSLHTDVIDDLIGIGIIELAPKGVKPQPPAVIKMLIQEHKAKRHV